MSCIDAAIIKALVEHVGMDPNSVHTHIGTNIPATWNTKQEGTMSVKPYVGFKLSTNETLPVGTRIRLGNNISDMFIIDYDSVEDYYIICGNGHINTRVRKADDGFYWIQTTIPSTLPNNTTTGLFKLDATGDLISPIIEILKMIRMLKMTINFHHQ